jgi:3,8-divinyl protochlorophyllide a 8-vinyl-reductase (ferredoxin)
MTMQEVVTSEGAPVTMLGRQERLQGRPMLCSDCGICASSLRPLMTQSCAFVHSHVRETEQRLHGRTRYQGDELLFGIFRGMYAARISPPKPHAQWSGIVTTLAARLLELGIVEGVITTRSVPGTRFAPQPILAQTPDEVRASAGNKPCISPGLSILDEARTKELRRLAVIGTGCQVQALRAMEQEMGFDRLYTIGIPCSDNVTYPDLMRFLNAISRSPSTIVHHEFVQDFRVWMRHENGRVERCNFVDIPMNKLGEIFPDACMACFDYPNSLADISIGYMGAPIGWQWLMVRTERGAELFGLIAPDLVFTEMTASGDRRKGVGRYAHMLAQPPGRPPTPIRKMIAFLQRARGPKGLEFARSITEMKLLRNLQHVRQKFPHMEARMVPYHVYEALAPYAEAYQEAFGRDLAPQPAAAE